MYFLHLYFVRTVHTNYYAKSAVSSSKNECVMLYLVFSDIPLLLRPLLCLKAFRQGHHLVNTSLLLLCLPNEGHLLNFQISLVPEVPQISFTPQNVAIDQGINLRVVPTSYDSLGLSYHCPSRSQQIYSICFSPNLSIQVTGHNHTHTHTHLDIQRYPILRMGRLKIG